MLLFNFKVKQQRTTQAFYNWDYPFKGTGTRDYNCLEVVWLDRPELVVLPDNT